MIANADLLKIGFTNEEYSDSVYEKQKGQKPLLCYYKSPNGIFEAYWDRDNPETVRFIRCDQDGYIKAEFEVDDIDSVKQIIDFVNFEIKFVVKD